MEVAAAQDLPPPVGTGPEEPSPGSVQVESGHTAEAGAGDGEGKVARHRLLALVVVRHPVRNRHRV